MDKDLTFTFRISAEELHLFKEAVELADAEMSMAYALRELMRWFASGMGTKLRLQVPIIYPKKDPAHEEPGDLHPE